MSPRRTATRITPVCFPRESLDPSLHHDVDSGIKNLKICTRRIQTALASHQTELRVLEKLHYKGNHQHRTALFWRRVVDIRRCSRRISEFGVDALATKVRLSFWDNPPPNSKVLKGTWTHVPDISAVRTIVQQVQAYRNLIDVSQERLMSAHNQFNLDLQTGAFLQLILVLTAVASRLHILLDELGSAVDQWLNACAQSIGVLDPSSPSITSPQKRPEPSLPYADPDNMEDDIGQSTTPGDHSRISSRPQSHPPEETIPSDSIASLDFMFTAKTATSRPEHTDSTPIVRSTVKRTERPDARRREPPTKRKSEASKSLPPKKKNKKDEIDDIFGF